MNNEENKSEDLPSALENQISILESTIKDLNFRLEVMRDKWVQEVNNNIELEVKLRSNKNG